MSPKPSSAVDARPRSKTTLFCPECSHESDADGDWVVDEEPARETHTCPVCGATIEVRTRLDPLVA